VKNEGFSALGKKLEEKEKVEKWLKISPTLTRSYTNRIELRRVKNF